MITGVFLLVLITLAVLFFTFKPAKAAGLTNISIALSNNAVSATGVGVTVVFTPTTAVTNGSTIDVNFDTLFTGGGALNDADITVAGTNITSSTESGFSAGHFLSTLTTSGSVTTPITISIDTAPGLTNPGTGGNYTWSMNVNIGGTGSTYDNGAGLAYVGNANQVVITAEVGTTLDLQLFNQNGTSPLAFPFICNLGTLSTTAVSNCTYDVGFSTNSINGATVNMVSDGQLRNGVNIIAACTGTNCNGDATTGVTAGSNEYGFQITDLGTGCSTTALAPYATADQPVPGTTDSIFANTATCDGATSANTTKRVEITHKASITNSTVVGSYSQLVTYSIFSN